MNKITLIKLITITHYSLPSHYQVHVTPVTLRRSMGQRSRSNSDGHRNLVNSNDTFCSWCWITKEIAPKLTQLFPMGPDTKCLGF